MGTLGAQSAAAVVDWVAALLLATALAGLLVSRLRLDVALLALQGGLLAAAALTVALAEPSLPALVAVLLTIAIKIVAIPLILTWVLQHVHPRRETAPVISGKFALLLGIGLVLVAYRVTGSLLSADSVLTGNPLPAAVALLLIGLLKMLTRRKALAQVIALVTMENGLYLLAVLTTRGLPSPVEIGVAVDVLTGVFLMVLLSRGMYQNTGRTSVDQFRELRG